MTINKYRAALIGSVVANAVLLVVLLAKRETTTTGPKPAEAAPQSERKLTSAQLGVLRDGDAEALRRAGVPAELINEMLAGRAYARYRARVAAIPTAARNARAFWQTASFGDTPERRKAYFAYTAVQRDYQAELRALFGEDPAQAFWGDQRYASLPAAKREQLRGIERDYDEMRNGLLMETTGFMLPSDQQKLQLLEQEKERDIRALLTAEERDQMDLRFSATASWIQNTFGPGIETEEVYRKVFALRKGFDERYPEGAPIQSPNYWQERSKAVQNLGEEIRAAIGDEAYVRMRKAGDREYRMLGSLEQRLNLPAGTAEAVYAERDRYAELSQTIVRDASRSTEERRQLLQALADKARAEMGNTLGAEGAEAFFQQNSWIKLLQGGTAFTTDPKASPNLGNGTLVAPVRN